VGLTPVTCLATDVSGLTATCSFFVTVTGDLACGGAFDLSGAPGPNGGLVLTVRTAFPNLHYHVQEADSLAGAQWIELPNVVFSGQGYVLQAQVFPSGTPRFYRVIATVQ